MEKDTDVDKIQFVDSRSRLPGRESFYHETSSLLKTDRPDIESVVLLTIEIEELELFLRIFGPVIRDDVIQAAAARILEVAGEEGRLYHITQFRFALVTANSTYNKAVRLTKKISNALNQPFSINGISLNIKSVIGVTHYPNHADNLYELVRTAAFATYMARKNKVNYSTYDFEKDEWEKYQFRLLKDIEYALEEDRQIDLALQPIVNLEDGSCAKMEGLCRWHHDELGNVAPGHFLPYVEQSPCMMALTETTLGIGLRYRKELGSLGFNGAISINLSTVLFEHPELFAKLLEQFQFYNVSPGSVIFEVTETGLMKHPRSAISTLNRLRDMGCQVAIDDFGTGHSSLAYLADLPIDIIKIDQCFIKDLQRERNQTIVGATAQMAKSLGFSTVAEGIEDETQYQLCRDLDIRYGQGYFIGKPMFKAQFHEWYKDRTAV